MDGREARNGVALVVFDSSFDFLVFKLLEHLEVLAGLLLVQLLKHGLDDAASRQSHLLLQLLVHFRPALALDLADISFCELGEQFPDEVYLLLAVLGQGLA